MLDWPTQLLKSGVDVDLNDGLLLEKYTKYTERLSFISSIGLKERANRMQIATDVNKLVGDVDGDLSVTSFIRCKDIYACPSVLYLCVHNNYLTV